MWHCSVNYAAGAIVKSCKFISMILCAIFRYWRLGVQMMSIVLLRPFVIATERSTDRPCALDIFDTTRSFTHMSNTCLITRLAFLNDFIDLLSCTSFLPHSTTSHQRIAVCSRTSKYWDFSERSWGFPNDCAAVWRLGNWDCSKKRMQNTLVNRSSDKQSESVTVWPKWMANTRLAT